MKDTPITIDPRRQIGKTHAQILVLKAQLINGKSVFIPTQQPAFFLSRLRAEGVNAKATRQYATGGLIQEFENGELVKVRPGVKRFTGYVFELTAHQLEQ